MSTSVYLADLRYNYTGFLANDCMPLGVGYIKAVMDRDLPEVKSRLFAYPDRLWEAMEQNPPDVLMLSNYVWNEASSFHFAKLAKRVNPRTLVVLGGPNIPIEPERQMQYFRSHPEIDVYVLGEGDFLATEVVQHFLDSGKSLQEFGRREVPSAIYRRDGEAFRLETWARKKDIDDIPSPWLSGAMDEFFDGKLAPLMETNRGCPFTCTFCVQGTSWYTKVHNFFEDGFARRSNTSRGGSETPAPRWGRCASPTPTTACSSAMWNSPAIWEKCRRSIVGRPTSMPPRARTAPTASSAPSRR